MAREKRKAAAFKDGILKCGCRLIARMEWHYVFKVISSKVMAAG
jgi:hypothetical protein